MSDRQPLNIERIVAAAAAVADDGGLAAVSMRAVGKALDAEAMSLYHHVKNKDALLDALADWIFTLIELPEPHTPWRVAMTTRAASARRALAAHPWALGLIESRRAPGPALLGHHDAVLGNLRANGFSVALASHTFSAIDAYVYGFVLTEVNLPFAPGEDAAAFASTIELPADRYPHLTELMTEMLADKDYAFADEFGYGLDLILDAMHRRRQEG